MSRFVFFLDIDGTLMTNGEICIRNRDAILKAQSEGHLVFINTARGYNIIPPEIFSVNPDGIISSLGCKITVKDKVIFSETIPITEIAEIFDYFNSKGDVIHLEGDDAFLGNNFNHNMTTISSGKEIITNYSECSFAKVYIPDVVLTDEEFNWLNNKYSLFQHKHYAEFAVKGNTKASAIKKVMEYLNIPIKYSVAMGDSINDKEMLETAGISVAMGDSAEVILNTADIITCIAAEGGVAEGIYKILKTAL